MTAPQDNFDAVTTPAERAAMRLAVVRVAPHEAVLAATAVVILSGTAELTLRGAPIGALGAGDVLDPDRLPPGAVATAVTLLDIAPLPPALLARLTRDPQDDTRTPSR